MPTAVYPLSVWEVEFLCRDGTDVYRNLEALSQTCLSSTSWERDQNRDHEKQRGKSQHGVNPCMCGPLINECRQQCWCPAWDWAEPWQCLCPHSGCLQPSVLLGSSSQQGNKINVLFEFQLWFFWLSSISCVCWFTKPHEKRVICLEIQKEKTL